MIGRAARASANFLIRSNAVCESDREVCEYGFHALYNSIVDIASILAIAACAKMLPEAIAYHIAFVPMRNTAGGWHAKTRAACFAFSTAIFAASLWASSHLASSAASISLGLFSALLVWAASPIEHENSPLSRAKQARMKKVSRILSIGLFAAILASDMLAYLRRAAMPLALGMASQSLLALMALASKARTGKN